MGLYDLLGPTWVYMVYIGLHEDHDKYRKDKTQEKEKKAVDILEGLSMKMIEETERTRRMGLNCKSDEGLPLKVKLKIGENSEGV